MTAQEIDILKRIESKIDRLLPGGQEVKSFSFDLSDPANDPVVKYTPKRWKEAGMKDYVGKRFSECEFDFLFELAKSYEYFATNPKPGKEQYVNGDRKLAALSRAWAEKNKESNWESRVGDIF